VVELGEGPRGTCPLPSPLILVTKRRKEKGRDFIS